MKLENHLYDALSGARPLDSAHPFAIADDGRETTYAQVFSGATQISESLCRLGVKPGQRVALLVPKSVASLQAYLGIIRAGGVLVPLNPGYTSDEVSYFLEDASPDLLVCDPERLDELESVARSAGVRSVATLERDGRGTLVGEAGATAPATRPVPRSPSDLAAILYTSGTTGRPKGAMLPHSALASNAAALKPLWRFCESDILIHALPTHHTHGLFVATNVALMAGCTLRFFDKFDADAVLSAFPNATAMMGVPTFYSRLMRLPELNAEAAARMRLFVSGSAPLLEETHREWKRRTGHEILDRYGMTETNMITSNPYDGPRKPGTVGIPLPETTVRIRDAESGAEPAAGSIGMLEMKGPGLFSGYWRMPEKTKAEFTPDGYFITGDFARRDRDGFITIAGRAKDLVISGGLNIYPKEVEEVIDQVPGVSESALFGVPHADFGEGLVAAVVRDGPEADEQTIKAFLGGKLARYKHPKAYVFPEELPRNALGKVQKHMLREEYRRLLMRG